MGLKEIIKTKGIWKHVVLASGAVLLFLWLSFLFLNFYTLQGKYMEVPDFKGVYTKDLNKFISDKNLEYIVVDSIYNDDLPRGTVIDQDPKAGSTVKMGRKVYLTVNALMHQKVQMPNLIDLSLRHAKSLLESYGLKIGRLTYVEGLPPVIQQLFQGKQIAPNTLIDKGSSIDLVLGLGNQNVLIPIPDLFGMTISEARILLSGSGLVMGTIVKDESVTDTLTAKIFRQAPIANQSEGLYDGAKVNIWLTGSEEVLERESKKNTELE